MDVDMPDLPRLPGTSPSQYDCVIAGWPRLARPVHTIANITAFGYWKEDNPADFQAVKKLLYVILHRGNPASAAKTSVAGLRTVTCAISRCYRCDQRRCGFIFPWVDPRWTAKTFIPDLGIPYASVTRNIKRQPLVRLSLDFNECRIFGIWDYPVNPYLPNFAFPEFQFSKGQLEADMAVRVQQVRDSAAARGFGQGLAFHHGIAHVLQPHMQQQPAPSAEPDVTGGIYTRAHTDARPTIIGATAKSAARPAAASTREATNATFVLLADSSSDSQPHESSSDVSWNSSDDLRCDDPQVTFMAAALDARARFMASHNMQETSPGVMATGPTPDYLQPDTFVANAWNAIVRRRL